MFFSIVKKYNIYCFVENKDSVPVVSLGKKIYVIKSGFVLRYAIPFVNAVYLIRHKAFLSALLMLILSFFLTHYLAHSKVGISSHAVSFDIAFNMSEIVVAFIFTVIMGNIGSILYQKRLLKSGYSLMCEVIEKNEATATQSFFTKLSQAKDILVRV